MGTVTIINQTDELVRLALYRKPVTNPVEVPIAWRIVQPPPGGGRQIVQVPIGFQVFARYAVDQTRPDRLDAETAHLSFEETTANFQLETLTSPDRELQVAVLRQVFEGLVMNEVRVTNNYQIGAQIVYAQDGDAVFEPRLVWPGAITVEDLRAQLYLAVVMPYVAKGQRLQGITTAVEVNPGGTVVVSGSVWRGYSLAHAQADTA